MPQPTIATARNWDMLANWLEAEWHGTDAEAHPDLHAMYEAFFTVADTMRNSPPDQREDCLFQVLTGSLTSDGVSED